MMGIGADVRWAALGIKNWTEPTSMADTDFGTVDMSVLGHSASYQQLSGVTGDGVAATEMKPLTLDVPTENGAKGQNMTGGGTWISWTRDPDQEGFPILPKSSELEGKVTFLVVVQLWRVQKAAGTTSWCEGMYTTNVYAPPALEPSEPIKSAGTIPFVTEETCSNFVSCEEGNTDLCVVTRATSAPSAGYRARARCWGLVAAAVAAMVVQAVLM